MVFLSRRHVEKWVECFAMYTDISVQEIPIRFNPNEISIDEIYISSMLVDIYKFK